ncbi:MAG: transposase [Planctomycetes bacterium]|nr:transposase [Planctomycetota bacterium]
MQLHADVAVDGRDRARLERLCRYMLRPPFAQNAVEETADGQVRVHFKKPRRSGATYAQMRPETFVARLCALVPPPRKHTVLYYGVLSARHRLRACVLPQREREQEDGPEGRPEDGRHKQLALFVPMGCVERAGTGTLLERQLKRAAPSRLSWAVLLARVFGIDGLECGRCGGPMRIVAVVKTADAIAAELHGARPPPKPSPPGQLGLFDGLV